jgi:hypothetical protein
MRIISEFHDYYDCIGKLDEDRETIYFRKEETKPEYPMQDCWSFIGSMVHRRLFSFCGHIYPYVIIERRFDGKDHTGICYDGEGALDFIRTYSGTDYYRRMQRRKWGILVDIRRYFDKKWVDLYPDTPIWFAGRNQKTILNPAIRAVFPQFVKIMPPAQAYQELVMWHGRRARPEPNIPAIPDSIKIEAAGFDLKTSFRKPKREP